MSSGRWSTRVQRIEALIVLGRHGEPEPRLHPLGRELREARVGGARGFRHDAITRENVRFREAGEKSFILAWSPVERI